MSGQAAFLGSETTSLPFNINDANQALSQFADRRGLSSFAEAFSVSPHRLSVSLAPDGTKVGDATSSLFASFRNLFNAAQLERTINQALQVWASQSNVNFGVVADSGDPLGTSNRANLATHGDIRIAAVPMTKNAYAMGLDIRDTSAGEWAGDILINSRIRYETIEQFYSVVLHEVGHILGLKHTQNERSPMYEFVGGSELTQADVNRLQKLYGTRALDANEVQPGSNDTFKTAVEIDHSKDLRGKIPSIVYGDIGASGDVDIYELPIDFNYAGDITLTAASKGFSLLAPKLQVFDENGNLLRIKQSSETSGDRITIRINVNNKVDTLYVAVSGREQQANFATGSYALSTRFDKKAIISIGDVNRVASQDNALLEEKQITAWLNRENAIEGSNPYSNFKEADDIFELEAVDDDMEMGLYRIRGVLAQPNQTRTYRIESVGNTAATATVSLFSRELFGYVPKLTIYLDEAKTQQVDYNVVTNERGTLVVQVENVASHQRLYLEVASGVGSENGKFVLESSFSRPAVAFADFSEGTLDKTNLKQTKTLYVAELQFLHLSLAAIAPQTNPDALLWMSIYEGDRKLVHRFATRVNETHSREILLDPGKYTVEFTVALPAGAHLANGEQIDFKLRGTDIGDPTGPRKKDPTETPIRKPTQDGKYTYPGGVVTTKRSIWLKAPKSTTVAKPPWTAIQNWYWVG